MFGDFFYALLVSIERLVSFAHQRKDICDIEQPPPQTCFGFDLGIGEVLSGCTRWRVRLVEGIYDEPQMIVVAEKMRRFKFSRGRRRKTDVVFA